MKERELFTAQKCREFFYNFQNLLYSKFRKTLFRACQLTPWVMRASKTHPIVVFMAR